MRIASLPHFNFVLSIAVAALLHATPGGAVMIFNDGGTHDIFAASDQIEIVDGPGNAPTTVNVQAGAVVGAGLTNFSVNARNNSIFTMSGGALNDELFLFDNASATVSGGTIGDDITANNNSSVHVTGGSVSDDIESTGTAQLILDNGTYGDDLEAGGTSVINVLGGTIASGGSGAILAVENGILNLHGGTITAATIMSATDNGVINVYGFSGQPATIATSGNGKIIFRDGPLQNLTAPLGSTGITLAGTDGSLANVLANDSSVIRIWGHSFTAQNGMVNLPYGPLTMFSAGNLSGVLADGTPFTNVPFQRALNLGGTRGMIVLQIPEPGAFALTSLAVAGLFVVRRRRRSNG